MTSSWEGIPLSDNVTGFQHDFSLNSTQITQKTDFIRAARSYFFSRANKSLAISFTVDYTFASVMDAERFCLTQNNYLPESGTLILNLGTKNVPLINFATTLGEILSIEDWDATTLAEDLILVKDAVLESANITSYTGSNVKVVYSFKAALMGVSEELMRLALPQTDLEDIHNWP